MLDKNYLHKVKLHLILSKHKAEVPEFENQEACEAITITDF